MTTPTPFTQTKHDNSDSHTESRREIGKQKSREDKNQHEFRGGGQLHGEILQQQLQLHESRFSMPSML